MTGLTSARAMHFLLRKTVAIGLMCACWHASATISLPSCNVDILQTTVSGISSGAYMTTQFSIAHSSIVKGVGMVAGGPSVKNNPEGTDYGWKTDVKLAPFIASQPTSCQMKRPAS